MLAVCAIGGPVALLLSYLALPRLFMDTSDQLGSIANTPGRYYLFLLFGMIGQTLLIPATLLIVRRTRMHAPRRAITGGTLAFIGLALGLVDLGSELMKWQMASVVSGRATMAAVVDGFNSSPGVAALLQGSGLALLVGFILLALALTAAGYPRWVGTSLAVGVTINLVGYILASTITLVASAALLLIGLTPVARATRNPTSRKETRTPTAVHGR